MPQLCTFNGIKIMMYSEPAERHKKPHVHVEYQGEQAVYSLFGEILEGSLPRNQQIVVKRWIRNHSNELFDNWELLQNGNRPNRIPI